MNRKSIHLLALPITKYGPRARNNLIELQGQNNGLQPQFTVQPQLTSFNPYQQQAQQEAMQVCALVFSYRTSGLDRHCRPNGQDSSRNG